ncbi:hypothetical protein Tsubulata_021715 [Turnera subulata]|uniref:Scarecrow-like protein 15 n=1 Tax=Turnera subulata TaxID=218843 RepID=A0A9Q0JC12_9ROSI|nr:hypothetical protein Tsubulata_021715 [Turnera subulata]
MKVPVSSPQNNTNNNSNNNNNNNQSPNPKPISFTTTTNTNNNNNRNFCYEPTSVLDLRRSPSPVTAGKPASTTDPAEWDDQVLQNLDFDSIMRELDFHDDSAPALIKNFPLFLPNCEAQIHNQTLPEFAPHDLDPTQFLHPELTDTYLNSIPPHNFTSLDLSHSFHSNLGNNWNYAGFDFIQELIRAADCFDSNELQLAQVILERLNPRLQAPIGKPLQRAAFYFKEALQSLLATGSTRPRLSSSSSTWPEIFQTIKAYKAFFSLSPIPMFTDFTTNQALLDTIDGSPPFIHVIDFDIGLGCQYASFMRELVERADACNSKLTTPSLRVTAVVQEECGAETKMIKDRLSQFAHELKVRFHIDFVLMRTFEMLSFKAINFVDGEKVAVLLTPAIFRRLGSGNNVSMFVNDVRRVSPNVVVCVDSEAWAEPGVVVGSSFRRNFVNCLEFYSLLFESLDAAVTGGGEWGRKIEMFLLKPRILAAVEGCRRRVAPPWREVFSGAGMRPVQFSQFAEFQADSLLGKVQVRGFYVAKPHAELVLCWHERPIIATSAWRC